MYVYCMSIMRETFPVRVQCATILALTLGQPLLYTCSGNDVVTFVSQIAMQNQINTNPESPDTVTIHAATPQFIIGPGGVVNLTGLVSSANTSNGTGI